MDSYFFIPGNHPKLSEKIDTIKASKIIIDLEDSVNLTELDSVMRKIKSLEEINHLYVRPRIFSDSNSITKEFKVLLKFGFSKFVVPKYKTIDDLRFIERLIAKNKIQNTEIILLIENAQALFSLQKVLESVNLNVIGFGLGSHDYCLNSGLKHKIEYLNYPRFLISSLAKAYGKKSIDIACMDFTRSDIFEQELLSGFNLGFDAKFIIHPKQLDLLLKFQFFTHSEISEAQAVLTHFENNGFPSVFTYNGRIIEPPHIQQYRKILFWQNEHESQ